MIPRKFGGCDPAYCKRKHHHHYCANKNMKLVGSFEFDLTSGKFLYFVHITFSRWKNERKFLHITFFSLAFFLFHQPKVQLDCCHLSTDSFRAYLPLRHLKRSRAHHLTHKLDLQRRGTLLLIAPPSLQSSTFKHQRRVSVSFFNLVIFPSPLSLSYTRGFPWTSNQKIKSISLSFFPLALHHFLSLTVSKPW